MKILHTISGLQKSSGGPSSCTYELVRALNRTGIDTRILTLAPKDPATDVIARDEFIHFVPNDALFGNISRNFHRALRQCDLYDLYHINGLWLYPNYDTMRFCQKMHCPYVVTPHGMLYPFALSVKKTAKKALRKLFFDTALRHADCIHATCDEEMKHIRALGFTNPVAVIPNCLATPENIAELRARRIRKRRIVFLGRLHPVKNLELILRAWSHASGTGNAELVIAGSGDAAYRQSLQSLCQSLHLCNVLFPGFVSGEEKLRLLADARAVVLMSKMENFGMTVPEALMVGTPALTGDQTPWSALPRHHCGWHIPTKEETLSQAFAEVLALPDTGIEAMGEAGIGYFEKNFSAYAVAGKMAALYHWILHQGEKPDFTNVVKS